MLDLDRFKAVNDTFGHGAGDKTLRIVADRLRSCAPGAATIARLGGDEFALLLKAGPRQHGEALALANGIIEVLSQPYDIDGHELIIGTSIGIAMAPEHGTAAEQLLRNADLALYRSKMAGRNGYCIFATEMEAKMQARVAIEHDLRHALERGEFELHYQTIVNLGTQQTCGVEALLRWRRKAGQLVYPGDFISIAEDMGLIAPIGKWVLEKACRDAMAWPSHTKLAVNLSPAQFKKGNLVEAVTSAIDKSGLPPHRLELEITESVLLESTEINVKVLSDLKEMGISIVLDDFGIGYSSLSYLSMFTFDKIKIDRSFVAELSSRAECAAIVSAITHLGRNLDITTVAEGVESRQQLTMLQAAGCSEAQGYLFSRPVPAEQLSFLVARAQRVAER
jgi:diguanylate cyclase (GGDEF)-like protein